jgi:threonine dehydratase
MHDIETGRSIGVVTGNDVLAAAALIAPHIVRTPVLRSAVLDEQVGASVFVKAEPLQRTGSFKLRGATNAILRLDEAVRARGVVAFSSGNHAQAVAAAAARFAIASTIVMPADAPAIKRELTARWGAKVVSYDRQREDREAIGARIAAETGASLIPPYDFEPVIAGQGTIALELVEDAGELDAVLVCTGGGGLTAGVALALEAVAPATRLYAVEPVGWDDTGRSLAAGGIVAAPGGSMLCDALLAPRPGTITFEINRKRLAGAAAVSDDEVLAAIRFASVHLKLTAEPGGAVALAALLAGKLDLAGKRVGVIVSGGNADPAVLARALS